MDKKIKSQIIELETEIKRLTDSLPAHSVPPSMLIRLEELEEKLESLKASQTQKG